MTNEIDLSKIDPEDRPFTAERPTDKALCLFLYPGQLKAFGGLPGVRGYFGRCRVYVFDKRRGQFDRVDG